MTDIVNIEVRGLRELSTKFNKMPAELQRTVSQAIDKSVKILQRDVARYPAKPPHSKYIRQNRLKKGWTTKVSGLRGIVGNEVLYAPYVQDEPRQAWFHKRTGWTTMQAVAEKNKPRIVQIIEAAVAKVLQGQ